ncbi:MAG: amidohydrolase family protein [Pseudomonadota bacterium]|nr:amidohydrolase family protein [Pseudomonadota bacterium]
MFVVDCDSHVMEPADLWQRYLEARYQDRAIRIEDDENGERLIIAEQVVLPGGLAGLGGANLRRRDIFGGRFRYADGCPPASYDANARLKMLDEWRVDACVTFPTIGILPIPTDDLDLINAYFRAYNTWQHEFSQEGRGRIVPIAVVNWRDVENAALELNRCLKLGFKGIFVPPEVVDGERPGSSYFDLLWAQLAEANLPGCLHVIVRFSGAAVPFSGWHGAQPRLGPTFGFGLGAPGQMIPALSSIILDGLFDRFPELKVVSVEAGCGWAAYLMDRLNEKDELLNELSPSPLTLTPGEYIQRNCYFVAEPQERTIGAMMELVGHDKILWGSDYPHIDSSLHASHQIRESVACLDRQQQHAIMGDNAAQLFQLDV